MGEWIVLSRGTEGTGVSRCPKGHIHVDHGVVTLRFDDEGFLAFARVLGKAARTISGLSEQSFYHPNRADTFWFSPN